MVELSSYWETTISRDEDRKIENIPSSCDVLIIGGGINGVSAAYHLTKLGVRVLLIEQHRIGWGASGRNGGMVLTGLKQSPSTLIDKYGINEAKNYFYHSLQAVDLVKEIITKEKFLVDAFATGHIEVANKQSHFDRLKKDNEILTNYFDHKSILLSARELNEELRSTPYFGGLLDEKSLNINPLKFVTQLADKAKKQGATIVEQLSVDSIEKIADGVIARTRFGDIKAKHLILNTSAYTGREFPAYRTTHLKIGSYILVTDILPFSGSELIRMKRAIFDSMNFLSYFRLTFDNRLLFGGRAIFGQESDKNIFNSVEILRNMMIKVFPTLHKTKINHIWGGTLDITINKKPVFCTTNEVTFSVGFAGHGIALATYFGKLIANKIIGAECSNPFEVKRINPVPFSYLQNAYLPFIEKYYRVLDIIN